MTEPGPGRLLVVDDEVELMHALVETLSAQGYDVRGVTSGAAALAELRAGSFDLMLTDLMMPGMDGLQLLRAALEVAPDLVVILMTGQGTIQTAVEALKSGATDYLLKPFKLHTLLPVLTRGLEVRRLRAENLQLREVAAVHEFAQALAVSLDARAILAQLAQGVLRHLPADGLAVFLPTADRTRLEAVTAHGDAAEGLLRRQVPLDAVRAAWAARDWEPAEGFAALGVPELAALPAPGDVPSGSAGVPPASQAPGGRDARAPNPPVLFPLLAGGAFGGVLVLLRAPGRRPWSEGTRTAVRILAGTAATALANAALVDEVRRAERKFRGIFEQSAEGIFQVRPDGTFLTANPALARMLGYTSAAELLAGPPERSPARRAGWRRFLGRAGGGERTEAELERRDGGTVWVAGTLRQGSGPEGPFVEGRVEDLTERKRLEANFLRAQRMEVVGSLAGGIAHDLNNVLAGILMAADNLQYDLAPEERQAVLDDLRTGAQRGVGIVRQVLAFARGTTAGDGTLRPAPLLRDLGKLLRHLLPRAVELRVETPDDLWPIPGDSTQLYQVLMNLCVNARDAMPKGGTLAVSAANSVVDAEAPGPHEQAKPGPYLRLTVADTGSGIPPGQLGHIFEPFFTTKPPGQGTGLGLATVHDIVHRHGGFVTVESEPGRGTRFDVYWPAREAPEARVPQVQADLPAGSGQLILVADSERSAAELARATLEAYGYRVLAAHDTESVVELLARHGGELRAAVLDAALAESAAAALAAWRSAHPAAALLVAGGPGAALPEPYTADDLLRALHAALHPTPAHAPARPGGGQP